MKDNLIELNGIDNVKSYSFKWRLEDNVEGGIEFKDKKLMGASISKEILNHKVINSFEDINNDDIEIFNNILILNAKFNLAIEYCEGPTFGKLNLINHIFYKTFFTSLENYDFSNIDKEILVQDFHIIENENKLYYYIDVVIVINEL